jgi:hypothetical protein
LPELEFCKAATPTCFTNSSVSIVWIDVISVSSLPALSSSWLLTEAPSPT